MRNKQYAYTVRGSWPFPVDMLRYDSASAASPADQAMIDRLSAEDAPDLEAFQPVEINLVGPTRPTERRWNSMLWKVPSEGRK